MTKTIIAQDQLDLRHQVSASVYLLHNITERKKKREPTENSWPLWCCGKNHLIPFESILFVWICLWSVGSIQSHSRRLSHSAHTHTHRGTKDRDIYKYKVTIDLEGCLSVSLSLSLSLSHTHTHTHTEKAVSVCSLTVTQAQETGIHKVTTEGSLILHVCTHTHAQTRKYKNLRELQRQTFYYQHNEHLYTMT